MSVKWLPNVTYASLGETEIKIVFYATNPVIQYTHNRAYKQVSWQLLIMTVSWPFSRPHNQRIISYLLLIRFIPQGANLLPILSWVCGILQRQQFIQYMWVCGQLAASWQDKHSAITMRLSLLARTLKTDDAFDPPQKPHGQMLQTNFNHK